MKKILFLFLAFTALASLAPTQDVTLDVREHVLSNGLKILLVPKPGITGIAHLHEHMMFKGTKMMGVTDFEKDDTLNKKIDALMDKIYRERFWKPGGGGGSGRLYDILVKEKQMAVSVSASHRGMWYAGSFRFNAQPRLRCGTKSGQLYRVLKAEGGRQGAGNEFFRIQETCRQSAEKIHGGRRAEIEIFVRLLAVPLDLLNLQYFFVHDASEGVFHFDGVAVHGQGDVEFFIAGGGGHPGEKPPGSGPERLASLPSAYNSFSAPE